MKAAVGGSLLLNLVVVFVSIVILFFVGIIAYSKAYKVKNRIIEVIERYETFDANGINELKTELLRAGYKTATPDQIKAKCGENSLSYNSDPQNSAGFLYCVYDKNNSTLGKAYEVVTYVRFDFPVIGDILTFPVRGETKVLGKVYDY